MKIIMDSGAYSAFTKKTEIDIYEYIKFIKRNNKYLECYINLDVIGDAEATWTNQKIMEDHGLSPMPVYHQGEPWRYLDKCMEYDYFGLGGIADKVTARVRIPFFGRCFEVACDESGMPTRKVHGLGMTSFSLMKRYPFYSVDSTSWLLTGAMGGVMIPKYRDGKYQYDEDPLKIAISSSSPEKGRGLHYDSLNVDAKLNVDRYLEEKGYFLGNPDVDNKHPEAGLYSNHYLRMKLNMEFFLDFRDSLPKWPWAYERSLIKRRLW